MKKEITIEFLENLYLADKRPWVITFSGGKDSTLVLHLVIELLLKFKRLNKPLKPTYIVSSDTRIEMPMVKNYLEETLEQIQNFSNTNNLNLYVNLIKPDLRETFFSLLIGKGYPSPNKWFRWCTDRLKIKPATLFLTELVKKHSSIIMLLGVRSDESVNRAKSINSRVINFNNLSMHSNIPNAYMLSPIVNWTTKEVWRFLRNNPPAWGSYKKLFELYSKGASNIDSDEDCNMALNPDSPSCGKSRFGCWTCTVVEQDRSMEGMIKSGETWMQPLLDYRKLLLHYRDDRDKRLHRRRNGQLGLGAFYLEVRKDLLDKLLSIQESKEFKSRGIKLISIDELKIIQEYWNDDGDIYNSVYKIAKKYGIKLENQDINIELDLENLNQTEAALFMRIYEIERNRKKSSNRIGILKEIENRVIDFYKGEFID